nr:uncharacterized protein LOC113816975 [Penaeus vannamei]
MVSASVSRCQIHVLPSWSFAPPPYCSRRYYNPCPNKTPSPHSPAVAHSLPQLSIFTHSNPSSPITACSSMLSPTEAYMYPKGRCSPTATHVHQQQPAIAYSRLHPTLDHIYPKQPKSTHGNPHKPSVSHNKSPTITHIHPQRLTVKSLPHSATSTAPAATTPAAAAAATPHSEARRPTKGHKAGCGKAPT